MGTLILEIAGKDFLLAFLGKHRSGHSCSVNWPGLFFSHCAEELPRLGGSLIFTQFKFRDGGPFKIIPFRAFIVCVFLIRSLLA